MIKRMMSFCEAEMPQELTAMLQPYMDLMSWDVRATYALDYDQQIQPQHLPRTCIQWQDS